MSMAQPVRDVRYVTGKGLVLPDGKITSFITTDELANLSLHPVETVRDWCRTGEYPELRWTRIGRKTRFFADSVIEFLEKRAGRTTKEVGSCHSEESKERIRQTMLRRWEEKRKEERKRQAAAKAARRGRRTDARS
jgi:hypothetical protein